MPQESLPSLVLGIDVEESVHSSVVKIKNMFKILDVEE
jgi:hypothetical protein